MASQVLSQYKQKVKGLELEPAGGGCFEVSVDGKLIYSKLQTGQFPDEGQMLKEIGSRL